MTVDDQHVHIDLGAARIDEQTLKQMAVTVGISKLKRAADDLMLTLHESRGHPGPAVWEGVALLLKLTEELYEVTFTYEQSKLDAD